MDILQALPEAGQIPAQEAADRTPVAQAAAQEAGQILAPAEADQIPGQEAADQILVTAVVGQIPEQEAADQILVMAAVGQTLPLEAAGQTPAQEAAGQTLPQAAGQTPEVPLAAAQKPAAEEGRQIQEVPLAVPQIQEVGHIHHLAVGQTLAAPAAYQMLEAAVEPQIQVAPQARPEERRKSHRTCRRASLVRRNEGSSWSPSRHGGPNRRPHRRQHTVLSTPRIKIEVEFVRRQPSTSFEFQPHDTTCV